MYVPLGNRNATMTRESLNGEGIRVSLAQASTKGVPRGMENSITRQFDSAGYFLEGVGNPVARNSVTVPVGKNIFTFARQVRKNLLRPQGQRNAPAAEFGFAPSDENFRFGTVDRIPHQFANFSAA